MESQRRQKWDHHGRTHKNRPPRGSWQPTVPSWEKRFCKVVGLMEWGTLLQLKKFMHLYENVINWNDSAGEEALCNAKKRFWADINGLSCDTSLPDPDLYIDEINWNEDIDVELLSDLEREPADSKAEENHDPVVIFGDSLLPDQAYSLTGWGDNEEDVQQVPAYSKTNNRVDSWEQNWGNSFSNGAASGCPDYGNKIPHFRDRHGPTGYATWEYSGNDNKNWNNVNCSFNCEVGIDNSRPDVECGRWNDGSPPRVHAGGYKSHHMNSMVPENDHSRNCTLRNDKWRCEATYLGDQPVRNKRRTSRKWNSFNSRALVGHKATIAVGPMSKH